MRRSSTEAELRFIVRWTAIGVGMLGCCLLIVLPLVQYRVNVAAIYEPTTGTTYLDEDGTQERRISSQNSPYRIQVEDHLRIDSEGTGRLELMRDTQAYAYLFPNANVTVVEASRQGTFFQHLRNQATDYQLTIQQQAGVVLYDFSQAVPPLAELNVILRFSDGDYQPQVECFQATAPTEGTVSAVVEVPCRSELEVTPTQPLSLP